MNYVYEDDYAVLVRLKVPEGASGTVPIRASAYVAAAEGLGYSQRADLQVALVHVPGDAEETCHQDCAAEGICADGLTVERLLEAVEE